MHTLWMTTYTGIRFQLDNPKPEMVDVVDIATSLSRIPHFNGHTQKPFSVAQHSILVMTIIHRGFDSPRLRWLALMHDAHEAYMGDVTRPVQSNLYHSAQNQIKTLKLRIDVAIRDKYRITDPTEEERRFIKEADECALATEWHHYMRDRFNENPFDAEPLEYIPRPVNPYAARAQFLSNFKRLSREMAK